MKLERRHDAQTQNMQKTILSAISASILLAAVGLVTPIDAQTSKTRAHVQTLASDRFEGRLAGSKGERLAGDYIVSQLQRIGAKALPGQRDFRLPFEFTAGTKDGGSRISVQLKPDTTDARTS